MSTTTLTTAESPIDISTFSEKEKNELIAADSISIVSGTTIAPGDSFFHPTKSLHINAKGIPVLRLPLASYALETSVHNSDGSVAYVSTREKQSSGNCVLADSTGAQLISTSYFFGPGRDPVLHILGNEEERSREVKTVSKWTSRTQKFLLPNGREMTWEYKREVGFGGANKKGTALVLSLDRKRIAVLIRNDETRSEGSKSCSAGNGGELLLGDSVGVDGKDGVSEEMVVATCLLMLKKEIDRRRAVQFMMIATVVSAGA